MGAFDKAKDKAEQLKGRAKEKVGDATDNHSMANEGRAEELKGKAKEEFHDFREEGDDKLHDAKERLTDDDRRHNERR
ncbi:CsbD family protein [Glycomyces sp. TRM65418]|uniref:CsbD family protein n=1 Tax=Glycomyces sp. TRM65418 TaxID=2867006 RepID=UPI001CE59C39|nr:CsbD family protein [Glycomyces sp. TRM65418]MCC3761653.1 CsbD family protein [Glycomyces sp. TRM65418]QZD55747.1 CsbD family protein [Glycomyces sp. TRM65418]